MSNIVALDLETTGLLNKDSDDPHQQPGIVQIGLVCWELGDQTYKWTYKAAVDPERPFEEEAKQGTGLDEEYYKDAPNFRGIFVEFAEHLLGIKHLITFNGPSFDLLVLRHQLDRYGLWHRMPWPIHSHDLMKISMDVLNLQGKTGNKHPKLVELHTELFGEGFEGAHDALNDAEATMRCAIKLHTDGILAL